MCISITSTHHYLTLPLPSGPLTPPHSFLSSFDFYYLLSITPESNSVAHMLVDVWPYTAHEQPSHPQKLQRGVILPPLAAIPVALLMGMGRGVPPPSTLEF